jgi:putative hydrolase of the HAD superfamily
MNRNIPHLEVIGFDADDTLWENLPYFLEVEQQFSNLMKEVEPDRDFSKALYQTELQNMALYGYGVKAFTLSLIETAAKYCRGSLSSDIIERIISMGKELLRHPVVLLEDVETVLHALQGRYRCVLITKGDLMDQERKLKESGLQPLFHHIEILSNKRTDDYLRMIHRLEIHPDSFMMVGDSIKSDILPALEIGSQAVHIPFHTTWQYEIPEREFSDLSFHRIERLGQLLDLLK